MEEPFRKDLRHLTWDEVYARQALRAELMPAWMDALELAPGKHVLEIGAGPGYVSFLLADRVGTSGIVYAVDRSAEALAHLERQQQKSGVSNIRRVVADAATLPADGLQPDAALVSMVLHHADDPAALVRNLHRLLPPGAPVVVAEFHPEGPCEHGAPRKVRLDPAQVQAWCEAAGFHVTEYRRQTPEHYMLVARR